MFVKIEDDVYINLESIESVRFYEDVDGKTKARIKFMDTSKIIDVPTKFAEPLKEKVTQQCQ